MERQLLSTLKDNGEKTLRFCNEIKKQIQIVKEKMQIDNEIAKTEKLFDQLTIKEVKQCLVFIINEKFFLKKF